MAVVAEEEAVAVGLAAAAAGGSDSCRSHRNVDFALEYGNYTDSDSDAEPGDAEPGDAEPGACQNTVG